MTGFNVIGKTPWGLCAYNRHDVYLGKCLEVHGEFSEDELAILRMITPVGSIFLDVGANIGAIAIPMAMHVGPMGAVVAFEPQRLMFQLLCANAAINSVGNLYPVRSAVGEAMGQVSVFPLDPNSPNSHGGLPLDRPAEEGNEIVAMLTIDSLPIETLARVSVIKIDVEGMEGRVIDGAADTIGRYRPFLYLENDRGDKSPELIDRVRRIGYVAYWDLPMMVRQTPDMVRSSVSALASLNMLCFPEEHSHKINLEPVVDRDDTPAKALERFKARAA